MSGIEGSTLSCLQISTAGSVTNTGQACGTGSGTVQNGIGGRFAWYPGSAASVDDNSHLDDGNTTAGTITSTEPVAVADATGAGSGFKAGEGTDRTGAAGFDWMWASSTDHRLDQNPNNIGKLMVPGIATAGAANDCVKLAANGIDLVDAGATCGTGGGGLNGVPTLVNDVGGSGTGGASTPQTGYTDGVGYYSVATGTGTLANSGIITVKFNSGSGLTFTPICWSWPANAAANNLAAQPLIPYSTVTSSQFVFTSGNIALPASNVGGPFLFGIGCKKPGT